MYNITVIVLLNFYLRRTSELLVLHPNFSPGTQWDRRSSVIQRTERSCNRLVRWLSGIALPLSYISVIFQLTVWQSFILWTILMNMLPWYPVKILTFRSSIMSVVSYDTLMDWDYNVTRSIQKILFLCHGDCIVLVE